ncbi:MAG TPA: carboxypeptidase regulatory-like domain-containing protein [Thermoanaerobaculia bacterium]
MRNRFRVGVVALGVVAVGLASLLFADGTLLGTISGHVLEQSGGGIPGAKVEVISAEKGFRRTQTADSTGSFTFPLLQPGPYTVRASLSGFQTVEMTNNIVAADRTTAIDITMRLATAAEELTVIGEVPLVDKTNTSATTTVRSTLAQKLAIGRNYQSLISNASGVTNNSDGNPNVHGALNSNNQYLIDGVDTTDVTTGTFGQNFNYEAIEEVVVSTAGISAEYGRAQGAIVNVITKSGTNDFSGSAKTIVTNDKWNEDNKGINPITGDRWNRQKLDKDVWRFALTFGGPFWKDHLWFFGAYEWADVPSPFMTTARSVEHPTGTGETYQQVTDVKLWDAKITFQATPSHLFSAAANSDPITGFVRDYWELAAGLPSAEREALTLQNQNDCGGLCVWQARWSGVFGSHLSGEALYAEQDGDIFVSPFEGRGSPYFSFTDELYYNGATFDGFVERPRKQANLALNLYTQLFGNSHNFKAGTDYQDLESVASLAHPNNESFFVTGYDPVARQPILSRGDFHLVFTEPRTSVSTGRILGVYVLDKFETGKNLFFNFGFRLDNQQSESDIGNTVIDSTTVSPRVTGVYDVFGNGKTLFSVAFGSYYQFLIQDITDSVYAGVSQIANYDLYEWNGTQFDLVDQVRMGGNLQPVNKDLKPSHLDEINVSVQQQLGNTMAIGLRGIYRKWNDLVDDRKTLAADGTVIRTPRNFSEDELARYYKGFELTFDKRLSRNWQASINYTLSRSEGNQASSYSSQIFDFAGLDCVVTEIGAIPCSTALDNNLYGYLPYDRTHIFQAFTAFVFPLRWVSITAAPSFLWQSGLPYQPQRAVANSRLGVVGTYLFEKRGSHRLPNAYQLDFALEAVFKPWGPIELGVKGEVFNVTNQQQIVSTAGLRLTPDANFGMPTSLGDFQAPRSYRFTGLVRF